MKWKNIIKILVEPYKKFVDFTGRARRREYWLFILSYWVGAMLIAVLSDIMALAFLLLATIPMISVSVRRLHDINKSGWWFLIMFIPIIGFYFIFLACKNSDQKENQFGKTPK